MGYKEMDQVYKFSKASRIDKFVLLTIAKTYNPGRGSWPSQEKIAELTGIPDARGVRRSLQRLQVLGELVWIRGSNRSGKSNVYFIPFLESKQADLTALLDTKMTAVNDQNDLLTSSQIDPLLNKGLNKLDKKPKLVFSSVPGSEFWDVIAERRPDLSFVERREFLEFFENSRDGRWWIDNAHTDEKLLGQVLACFPSAKGEISEH
jgi:alkylated DNA nucleotide flippase Atl1